MIFLSRTNPTTHTRRPPHRAWVVGGFTLIELLVVISIIALLIGILLPALGAARDQARALNCLTKARSIAQALTMYLHDHADYFPPTNHQGFGAGLDWDLELAPYLGAPEVRLAVVFGDFYLEDNEEAVHYYNHHLRCPADERTATYEFSYAQSVYPSLSPDVAEERTFLAGNLWHRASSLPAPSATVIHGEVSTSSNHIMAHYWITRNVNPQDDLALRHRGSGGGGLSTTFADGHATLGLVSDTFSRTQQRDRWNPATAR
ncbi:MAG: prepilin-type N-terminal cleavage/methylation domain-containing protein [Phycisphaeraceae bacterium]